MKARWDLVLVPSLIISFVLMITSQLIFLKSSLFKDLGLGRTGDEVVLTNYIRFFTDDF